MADEVAQARIIHHDSVVEDWILHAQEVGWDHSSSPTVFVTYAGEDSKWLDVLEKWCDPELRNVVCVTNNQPYRLDYYSSPDGTTDGRPYPSTLAEQMWRCHAAIVVVSQDYFQSPICHSIELRFLAWRQRVHGMRLWVLRVGETTQTTSLVAIPEIQGKWPMWHLNEAPDDRHPNFNAGLPQDHEGVLITRLTDDQRDYRMRAFAETLAETIRKQQRVPLDGTAPGFRKASEELTTTPVNIPDVKVGEFPQIGVFEGRQEHLATLSEAARGTGVAVAGIAEIGGQGKTMLGLRFIQKQKDNEESRFEGYFSFTFYGDTTGDKEQAFADALTRFLTESLSEAAPGPQDIQLRWLWDVLRRRAVCLFLDGMEEIQAPRSSQDVGALQNGIVLHLLYRLCSLGEKNRSFALLTSRLPFPDLARFPGSFLPLALGGLLPPEGAAALRRWGVEASDAALEGYSRDLEGHPLGILAFANSINRTASLLNDAFDEPGAVAAFVAREAALARPDTPEGKVYRMLDYYRSVLTEAERSVLEVVTLDPDGIREDFLRQMMWGRFSELSRRAGGTELEKVLSARVLSGILQPSQQRGHRSYSCHPIIRQSFRPQENGLAFPIAALYIADRPPKFKPRTLSQVRPYLKMIAILAADSQFQAASNTLVSKLDSGDLLFELRAFRELFDCLMQFFGPEQRDACLEQLGTKWFNAMLPRMVDCCMVLNEWNRASEFNALDKEYLRAEREGDAKLNQTKQAEIDAEIGSIRAASNHLMNLIHSGSVLDQIVLLPMLADYERYRGRPELALERLGQWLHIRPTNIGELRAWVAGWDPILETLVRIGYRSLYSGTTRYFAAISKATSLSGADLLERSWYLRELSMSEHEPRKRSRENWEELLDLSEKLGKVAERQRRRGGKAGWMHLMVQAMNQLGRPDEALDEARLMLHDLDERSWRQIWLEEEIARSHLLRGDARVARDLARDAMSRAVKREMLLLASSIAELLLDILVKVPDPLLKAEARKVVEASRVSHLGLSFPDPDTLPGEPNWNRHLSQLFLECLDPIESGASSPTDLDRALGLASELNLPGVMTILLGMGASPTQTNPLGKSPLQRAVETGSDAAFDLLLGHRRQIDLSEEQDKQLISGAITAGRPEMLRRLLRGAMGLTDDAMVALLIEVARIGSEETLEVLVEFGARIEHADSHGRLPQIVAAAAGNRAFLEKISSSIDLSLPDKSGMTALMAAARYECLNVIDFLADARVDPTIRHENGMTALDFAADAGQVAALLRLASRFELPLKREHHLIHALVSAASHGWNADIEAARNEGLQLSDRDDRGWTALTAMALHRQDESLKLWLPTLSAGEIDIADSDGGTALMAAASKGNESTVELLLKAGASPSLANAEKLTAFDAALYFGQIDTLKILLRHVGTYLHAGRVREVLSTAVARGHSGKLIALVEDAEFGRLLAHAIASRIKENLEEKPSEELVTIVLGQLVHDLRLSENPRLPQRHPRDMSEDEVDSARCVVGGPSSSTFGRLTKIPLPEEITACLARVTNSISIFESLDVTRARGAALPFLPEHWLVLLPHKVEQIEVPLILTLDTCTVADSTNLWLYEMMNRSASLATPETLLAYAYFFFSVVVGKSGAFFFTHDFSELLWNEGANDAVKQEFASKARALALIESPDGRREMRGTVVFKNALFETSIMVGQNWEMELANEKLLMEDLPIEFGRRNELLVRY